MATFGPPLVVTSGIVDNAVTNAKMADDSVKAAEIEAGAVGTSEIADTSIVNDDVSASAEIVDTKLATISTAGKVDGAAITGLANLPGGAGGIPSANLPSSVQTLYVPLESTTGGRTLTGDDRLGINCSASAETKGFCEFFVPSSATITSIIVVASTGSGAAGNVVFDYLFQHLTAGGAVVKDSSLTNVAGGWGTSDYTVHTTIPAAGYGGLTKGIPWTLQVSRQGANGSDSLGSTINLHGVLITLS